MKGKYDMCSSVTTRAQWLCTESLTILVDIPQMPQQSPCFVRKPPPILQVTPPTRHSKIMYNHGAVVQRTCKHQEY